MTYADMNRSELLDQSSVHPNGQPSLAESREQKALAMTASLIGELYEGNGGRTHSAGELRSEEERIGCLECIIAALLEKNERMRQQLLQHMN
jgi:hypothetical protein